MKLHTASEIYKKIKLKSDSAQKYHNKLLWSNECVTTTRVRAAPWMRGGLSPSERVYEARRRCTNWRILSAAMTFPSQAGRGESVPSQTQGPGRGGGGRSVPEKIGRKDGSSGSRDAVDVGVFFCRKDGNNSLAAGRVRLWVDLSGSRGIHREARGWVRSSGVWAKPSLRGTHRRRRGRHVPAGP